MKKTKFISISLLLIVALFSSCKEKETEVKVDPRDQLVGTYEGIATMTIHLSSIDKLLADSIGIDTVTIVVTKDASVADGIILKNGDVSFKGNGAVLASNGVAFNVPNQTVSIDGTSVGISGFNCFSVGDKKYSGGYESASKTIAYGFGGTIKDGDLSVPFTTVWALEKK